jgi:hypothetical protein
MTGKDVGLFEKYRIERVDGRPIEWAFVLEASDPLALVALEAYAMAADSAGYGQLAADLRVKTAYIRMRYHPMATTECFGCGRFVPIGGQCPHCLAQESVVKGR